MRTPSLDPPGVVRSAVQGFAVDEIKSTGKAVPEARQAAGKDDGDQP